LCTEIIAEVLRTIPNAATHPMGRMPNLQILYLVLTNYWVLKVNLGLLGLYLLTAMEIFGMLIRIFVSPSWVWFN